VSPQRSPLDLGASLSLSCLIPVVVVVVANGEDSNLEVLLDDRVRHVFPFVGWNMRRKNINVKVPENIFIFDFLFLFLF